MRRPCFSVPHQKNALVPRKHSPPIYLHPPKRYAPCLCLNTAWTGHFFSTKTLSPPTYTRFSHDDDKMAAGAAGANLPTHSEIETHRAAFQRLLLPFADVNAAIQRASDVAEKENPPAMMALGSSAAPSSAARHSCAPPRTSGTGTPPPPPQCLATAGLKFADQHGSLLDDQSKDAFVIVRVRPILSPEHQTDAVPVVTKADGYREAVLLAPKISVTCAATITPMPFLLDRTYGVDDTTEAIYSDVVRPLVSLASTGASTAIIAYGQTGSGKTYTTSGLMRCMAHDLAACLQSVRVSMAVVEIQGDVCRDLLSPAAAGGGGNTVQILEDAQGNINLQGATTVDVASATDILSVVASASAARATKATGRNDVSSRSHMVVRVTLKSLAEPWAHPGVLNIADLAGSESTADSATHDKERLAETKFINASLMTFKDCVRNRASVSDSAKHLHIPFRQSKLTLLLKDCFELNVRRPVKTVVLTCVSPLLKDVRHSLNTLRYAAMLAVTPKATVMAADPDDPSGWPREQALEFIHVVSRKLANPTAFLPEGDGRALCALPEVEFVNRLMASSDGRIASKDAQQMYLKLWKLVVDARTRRKKEVLKPLVSCMRPKGGSGATAAGTPASEGATAAFGTAAGTNATGPAGRGGQPTSVTSRPQPERKPVRNQARPEWVGPLDE